MDKKWNYTNEAGEVEEVQLEKWMWAVQYDDDTELHQFDDNGVFHRIGEVEQDRVKLFALYQPQGEGRIDIVIPQGAKIIHKYRHIVLNALTEGEQKHKVYVFGYKLGEHTHLNFVLPSGLVVQTMNDDAPKLVDIITKQ